MVSEPGIPVSHIARRDIDLAPDNGLDPEFFGGLVKDHGPEEIPVIRNGSRRKSKVNGLFAQIINPDPPVQKRILGVAMQVGKISHKCRIGVGRHTRQNATMKTIFLENNVTEGKKHKTKKNTGSTRKRADPIFISFAWREQIRPVHHPRSVPTKKPKLANHYQKHAECGWVKMGPDARRKSV